jgi:hypothetical protein
MNQKQLAQYVTLRDAAEETGASYEVVRRAVGRLGAGHRDADGRVLVPAKLAKLFKLERQRSGYLHPRGAKLADLIQKSDSHPEEVAAS